MIRLYAVLFGLAFLAVGYIEYFQLSQTELLFGYFEISSTYYYLHFVFGAMGLVAFLSPGMSKAYFVIIGFFYVTIAIMGFALDGDLSLIQMHATKADTYLHAAVGALAWYFASIAEE